MLRAGIISKKHITRRLVSKETELVAKHFGQETASLSRPGDLAFFYSAATAHINTKAFDFLVQCGKRNHKTFRGFRLIPTGALQHIHNDSTLDFVNDLEERRVRTVGGGSRTGFARQRRQKLPNLQTDPPTHFLS